VFAELGHIAIGLEGAAQFAAMGRAYSGCKVRQQDFLKLTLFSLAFGDCHIMDKPTSSRGLSFVTPLSFAFACRGQRL